MSIMLDMNKTYDRVEWNYLSKTMVTMGFPPVLGGLNHGLCDISIVLHSS